MVTIQKDKHVEGKYKVSFQLDEHATTSVSLKFDELIQAHTKIGEYISEISKPENQFQRYKRLSSVPCQREGCTGVYQIIDTQTDEYLCKIHCLVKCDKCGDERNIIEDKPIYGVGKDVG